MQFKGKLMNQTGENGKKTKFGPGFGQSRTKFGSPNFFSEVLFLVDVISCCRLYRNYISLYPISRKTYELNSKK